MRPLTFAILSANLLLAGAAWWLQQQVEETLVSLADESAPLASLPEPEHRYYKPCISCATTVFDRAGNVIDTLPPTE